LSAHIDLSFCRFIDYNEYEGKKTMNAPMKKHALPPSDQAKDVQEWLERRYAAAIQANQYEEVVRFLNTG
jgi:hypothetical protein